MLIDNNNTFKRRNLLEIMAGKTVLITGSSRGLGKELAWVFARNSWDLILHGRDEEALDGVESAVRSYGVDCEVIIGDLTSRDTLGRLGEAAEQRALNVLINNAGVYAQKPFNDMSSEEFDRIVEVNLLAPVRLIKEIYPTFQRRESGLIVNVNSVAGLEASGSEAAYCASKHGLRAFARAYKYELRGSGIRVTDVYPGAMQTEMTDCRDNQDKLMEASEVANCVYGLCEGYPSVFVDEVRLGRTNY